jgi:hypothetical protein
VPHGLSRLVTHPHTKITISLKEYAAILQHTQPGLLQIPLTTSLSWTQMALASGSGMQLSSCTRHSMMPQASLKASQSLLHPCTQDEYLLRNLLTVQLSTLKTQSRCTILHAALALISPAQSSTRLSKRELQSRKRRYGSGQRQTLHLRWHSSRPSHTRSTTSPDCSRTVCRDFTLLQERQPQQSLFGLG